MDVPRDSIYFWMYTQGLKHVPFEEIETACAMAGKEIRAKDRENYWNGFYRSDLYGKAESNVFELHRNPGNSQSVSQSFFDLPYSDYPQHPYLELPEISNRWVPCSKENKPLVKWGNGCMSLADAKAYRSQVYLAENLKGCKIIVIDCDGDHGDGVDNETVNFLNQWFYHTHCIYKDNRLSFHLTFAVDKVIPTMHFPYAHIDVVGNRANSLRYFKNKKWNGLQPMPMTDGIWEQLKGYIRYRKELDEAIREKLARISE